MKKRGYIAAAVVLLGAGIFLLQCDPSGGTDDAMGGAGADFDASQYYTRSQVDSLFASAKEMTVIGNPETKTITTLGTGGAVSFPSVPSGTTGAFINVGATNSSGGPVTLRIIASDPLFAHDDPILTMTLQSSETILITCHVNVFFNSTDWRIWNNGSAAVNVGITPKIWLD